MSKSSLVSKSFASLTVDSLVSSQSKLQTNLAGTSITLGSAQSGDVTFLNASAGSLVRLPAPLSGLNFQFVVNATGGHVITSPSAVLRGVISNASTSASLLTGSTSISCGSAAGDYINIVSDGTSFFVSGATLTTGGSVIA